MKLVTSENRDSPRVFRLLQQNKKVPGYRHVMNDEMPKTERVISRLRFLVSPLNRLRILLDSKQENSVRRHFHLDFAV
jgi:hypothetical protein